MRGLLGFACLLAGCSLIADSGGYTFEADTEDGGSDAGADAGQDADTPDADMPECVVGDDCRARANATSACEDDMCVYECNSGFADCDDALGGCETETDSDTLNCGECGVECAGTNAVVACDSGSCIIESCNAGYADCDGMSDNGCEVDLRDVNTCGSCDSGCLAGELCDATGDPFMCSATCDFTICSMSCVNTESDVANCGGCGVQCPTPARAAQVGCEDSGCTFVCQMGSDDCDGDVDNGCEVTLTNDPENCGACDQNCDLEHVDTHGCVASECTVEMCEAGFEDCDTLASTGCEAELATDAANCGSCGYACRTGECINGICDPAVGGAGGRDNLCAIRASGALFCMGRNTTGVAGPGIPRTPQTSNQVFESALGDPLLVDDVAVGDAFACAVLASGSALRCWGEGQRGRLGTGDVVDQSYPAAVTSSDSSFAMQTWSSVSAGEAHACAIDGAGDVWCWGDNRFGQVGVAPPTDQHEAVKVTGLPMGASSLALGQLHSCAHLINGSVYCWGADDVGQLGNDAGGASEMPGQVAGLANVAKIGARWRTTCALTTLGEIYCWGENVSGNVGPRTGPMGTTAYQAPYLVPLTSAASDLAVSYLTTCALTTDGARCWGRNYEGQFGSGMRGLKTTNGELVEAPLIDDMDELIGGFFTPAGLRDGLFYAWGQSDEGELPRDDFYLEMATPMVSELGSEPVLFDALTGGRDHACGLRSGTVYCWGNNGSGESGNGDDVWSSIPVQMGGFLNVISLSAGTAFTCIVGDSAGETQQAFCSGSNTNRRLGSAGGTTVTPRLVELAGQEDEVAAGDTHACARQGGDVFCWGNAASGRTGHTGDTPAAVPGISTATAIAVGSAYSCAILGDGSVSCWGDNATGQLGDGTMTGSMTPVSWSLPAGRMAEQIVAGAGHSCVIANGFVYCWGANGSGQVGIGSTTNTPTPTLVNLPMTAVDIAAGLFHVCAVMVDGAVSCWGIDDNFQLGDAATDIRDTPVMTFGPGSATAVGAAWRTSFMVNTAGEAQVWGSNVAGVAGLGSPIYYPSPTWIPLP